MHVEKPRPEMTTSLNQDPHRTRDTDREKVLEVAIGREVRAYRRQQHITVAELSAITGISIGMLSKIENGNTSPSLTTLQNLANALSVPLTSFFNRFEEQPPSRAYAELAKALRPIVTVRAPTISIISWVTSARTLRGVMVEPYLITLTEESDVFPTFQHGGIETIYVLEGEVDYRHGDDVHSLQARRYVVL